jgi:hypothetical protein
MTSPESDLNLFRDFVLSTTEKAALGAAILGLGRWGIEDVKKPAKKAERRSALEKVREQLLSNPELGPHEGLFDHTITHDDSQLTRLVSGIEKRNKKQLILIELFFAAPYPGTKHTPGDKLRKKFISWLASEMGLEEKDYKELLKAYKGTLNVHMGRRTKIGIGVVAGLAIGAAGGWVVAPAIGGALGGAAGLGGAAAVSHGLALLGGGALAAGGAGMAGGIALVTAMGAVGGGLIGLGGTALFTESGAAQVKVDTMKLQMVLAKIVIADQKDMAKAQEIARRQEQELQALRTKLAELRKSEADNKEKIKNLKSIIKTLERSVKWTRKQSN